MEPINKMTAETILEESVFKEIYEDDDEFHQAQVLLTLTDRAKDLGVKNKFETMYKAYKKAESRKEKQNKELMENPGFSRLTDFSGNYPQMNCGSWIANDNGVHGISMLGTEINACYHPILPVQRLINCESGKEKITIAYKKGFEWDEITIDKGTIASASKIVALADYGISVTSENAKNLVKFLSDVENMNINKIPVQKSTTKLGWHGKVFVPYDNDIIFDGDTKFKDARESIVENGNEETWMNLVRKIRKGKRFEPKISLIGSLASVLIEPLNALPFVLNLWGDTGKGKTVVMMLSASVWANPGENNYVTDPKSTVTALELRLDFLNNLPMLIDDMAQVKEKYNGDFTELIYMLCSGKGKDRANTSLGLNKSTTWRSAILTNGEHSLVTETMQGGAVNRIIDVEMEDGYIFENGNQIVETIKKNYGFCGRRFLEAIEQIGIEQIKEWQQKAYNKIIEYAESKGVEKEEKQILPMSILLVADKIATDYIFQDGEYLDFERCVDLLKNKGEVSEHERAYQYIINEVQINISKFKPSDSTGEYKGEVWGSMENGYVIFLTNAFNRICEKGNFSSKSFLSWANKKDLLDHANGRNTKQKRMGDNTFWCVFLKLPESDVGGDGFMKIPEDEQGELPFN